MQTIEQAAADCRSAWEPYNENWAGMWGWCVHHNKRMEPLSRPPEERIRAILRKPVSEQVVRLRNFRPLRVIPNVLTEARVALEQTWEPLDQPREAWVQAWVAWDQASVAWNQACRAYSLTPACDAAHREDVPGHTWNGSEIFGRTT